jgi:hypothetical protein
MELDAFAERVMSATTMFRYVLKEKASQQHWYSAYDKNASQYEDKKQIIRLYLLHLKMIVEARKRGYNDILDVGSGINCAKIIDPSISSSNPLYAFTGESDLFRYIGHALDIENDVILGDCFIDANWIQTYNTYDCLFVIRFIPWPSEIVPWSKKIYTNIITELDRVLRPNGVVWYNPIDHEKFKIMSGDTYQLWEPVDQINHADYFQHYGPIYQITKADLHKIASSL